MSRHLIDQPSARPTRKQLYVAVAGVLAYVLTTAAGYVWGMDIPEEITMAVPLAAGWLAGYIVREDAPDAG